MNPNLPGPTAPEPNTSNDNDPASARVIATGGRNEEIHFEADPDQLVVVRHEVRPRGPLPIEDPAGAPATGGAAPVEDVRILPREPSVWDARPLDSDEGSADH